MQQQFLDSILNAMENPGMWKKSRDNFSGQCNRVSKKSYRGMNAWYLSYIQTEKNYTTGQRLTYNQCKELKGQVKKGEKSTQVIFFSFSKNDDPLKEDMVITKRYNVFNVDQCQDITPLTVEEQNNLVDIAIEEVVNNYIQRESIKITTNPDGNYYSPRIDSINMVELKHFKSSQQYYHTFFHECIHSTGTESRLNRKELQQGIVFGSHDYSIEELTAEFGAAIMDSITNNTIDIQNSANYLASRSKKIKKENRQRELYWAIQRAQKACDFILPSKEQQE